MKYAIILSVIISSNVFAYYTSPVGNDPVPEKKIAIEKREPASVSLKGLKPGKLKPKVAPEK